MDPLRQGTSALTLYKGIPRKYKGKIYISVICIFCLFFSILRVHYPIDQFVWSIRFFWYPYWHTLWHFMSYGICHKTPFYDVLWHMIYDIKCHKVCQYGYQKKCINQTNWAMGYWTLRTKKIMKNMQKTEMSNFPLYFWPYSFVNTKTDCAAWGYLQIFWKNS